MALTPLNSLNAFLAVARTKSFAAAAAQLKISPSALSQAVRQLETRVGAPLLTRTTRSVAMTAAGRQLLEQAGPGIEQALTALSAVSAKATEVTGKVRLTVPSLAIPLTIAPILPEFARRHPRVEVEVQVTNRRIDIVSEGYDAGIRLEEHLARDMVHVRLTGASRFIVVGSPAYLKRKGTPQSIKDLLQHDCLCFRSQTTGGLFPWDLDRGPKTIRARVSGTITSDDERVLLAMAEAGLGLAYVFEPEVTAQLKKGTLRVVLDEHAGRIPGFFLYFPNRAQVSSALRAFIDVAREVTAGARVRGDDRGAVRSDRKSL